MRTPPQILKSVVFLGKFVTEDGSTYLKLGGTAFVVSVAGTANCLHLYLVTARHSVKQLKWPSGDQGVRANNSSGIGQDIRIEKDGWFFHPTEESSVDVVVQPFTVDDLDVVPIPTNMFLGDEEIADRYIGQGDEVSITGLFTKLAGVEKNVPILRRGSIAMFPDEKIQKVNMGGGDSSDVDGYLVEVRSVGGLSGSPAFVRAPIGLDFKVHTRSGIYRKAKCHVQGDYFFLGLMQGHWEIPPDRINTDNFPRIIGGEDSINLGIAIVVPAKKILEVLHHPRLVSIRKEREAEESKKAGATEND